MSQLKVNELTNINNNGEPNIELHQDGSTSIRNLQNLAENVIINGEMAVSQYGNLGARSVNNSVAAVDRFTQRLNLVTSQFAINQDFETPPGFQRSLQWACTTAAGALGAGEFAYISQKIEGFNSQVFAKGTSNPKNFSVSFWVRSNLTGTYSFRIYDNKNTRMVGRNYTIDTADTWELKTFTIDGESTGNELDKNNTAQLEFVWWLAAGSGRFGGDVPLTWQASSATNDCEGMTVGLSSSTNNRFYLTGVQITPTDAPIEFQHKSIREYLTDCQRYFQLCPFANGFAANANEIFCNIHLYTPMRADPSMSCQGPIQVNDSGQNTVANQVTVTTFGASNLTRFVIVGSFSGLTRDNPCCMRLDANTNMMTANAEL